MTALKEASHPSAKIASR